MPELPKHLHSKAAWFKVIAGLVVGILGVVTQFDVTINKEVTRPKWTKVERVSADKLVKRDGEMDRQTCMGLEEHKGHKRSEFLDTYGVPKDEDSYEGGTLSYHVRGEDAVERCMLQFDYKDRLEGVTMDLWYDHDGPGPFG